MNKFKVSQFLILVFSVLFLNFSVFAAAAPQVWQVNTRAEVLRGDARGVSITDNGTIVLAPRLQEVYNTQQSFVWSSASDAAGNVYLGTGNDGRIFRVGANGQGSLFFDSNELDVTAIVVGRDNQIYAATSPDGKVYRIDASGKAETFFDPADKYIWSLALMQDGSLAVGSGENGKIYRVRSQNAAPENSLLFDSSETHIITLTVDRQGNLIAGTDSNGLVLRVSADGKAFALLDAPLREIRRLSVAPDGSIYALALSETASASNSGNASGGGGNVVSPSGATVSSVTVTVSDDPSSQAQTAAPARSRNDLTNAKSAVFRILPDGGYDTIWSSANVTGFSLVANPAGGVFVGTSDKGRIYSVTNDGRETLLLQSNEGQISNLESSGNGFLATSSNQGKLYRFGGETVTEGIYESTVRDARASALWGRIWWRGQSGVELQTRTGNTERPDATWSEWSAAYREAPGSQISSPRARFLQWRAVLRGGAPGATAASLSEVNISYLPRNIAPEVLSLQVLPTNVGLQANPPPQVDPNIENSGLDPQVFGLQANVNTPPRRLYQRGARSLIWTAEDRNGDRLEYAVYYRAVNESAFRLLKDSLRETFFTVDGAALADGRYIFKVAASDAPENPAGTQLAGERESEPVDIDNTPPAVTATGAAQIVGERARVVFDVVDAASYVQRAEISINGREWQTVYADDGISDSPRERFTVEFPVSAGEHTISLRAFDANGNIGSARVTARR
ncbi:MAG: WD40 repeat domain-containing protein [Acidobacteriota bacterium]|nr:WD40 repeat domain-containing protein [Acidobacteriota bacterium]